MSRSVLISISIFSFIFGVITFLFPFILPVDTINSLVHEDSVIEYMGALFFLLAGVFFLLAFLNSNQGLKFRNLKTRKNYIYLALFLILVFGAGEEISWGQRLIGFKTPESLQQENIQEEFTVHNLPAFDPTNTDSFFNMNRMFIYFWFLFGIGIPIVFYLSDWFKNLIEKFGVPVVPILLGGQFLIFYILSKFYGPLGAVRDVYEGRIVEFRETQHALIFFLIALYFFMIEKRQKI